MQFVSFGVTIENVSRSACELSGTPAAVALLSDGTRLRGVPTTFTGSAPPPKRVVLSASSDASLILGSSAACATFSFRAPYIISVRLLLDGGYFQVAPAPGKPVPTRCGLAVSALY